MKKIAIIVSALALTSCTALDVDGVRLSGGGADVTGRAEVETNQGTYRDSGEGTERRARLELTNQLSRDTDVGLLLGYGSGQIGDVDTRTHDVGFVLRHYLATGDLRPFVEGAAGYRRMELHDELLFGSGRSDMLFGAAATGLELRAGEHFSIFGSVGYEGAHADGFDSHGPTFFLGGGWKF